MRAYGKWILVEEIEETKTSGGLYIVEKESSKKILKGKVLSVGPDVKSDISEGDIIVADHYAGSEYNGQIFVSEDEVQAVLVED